MPDEDAIWARAREDLVLIDDQGREDVFLWEHHLRVARSTQAIAALPEAPGDKLDHTALTAAALYHCAGWAIQLRQQAVTRKDILCRIANRQQRELAAGLLEQRLAGAVPAPSLRRAQESIEAMDEPGTNIGEARVLADAEYLDHIAPLLQCKIVRRLGLEGKGVQATIDDWVARKDYHYFDGLIEAFHFDTVRTVARRRLEKVDRFMADLAHQHSGEDLGLNAADFIPAATAAPDPKQDGR
ncbi:MAG: hypothetical protein ACYSUQ_11510 [Planctomycetota bacterium]|jgi:hypothetical protein